jgi:4-hydroxybenzoate polyprenyltransferase
MSRPDDSRAERARTLNAVRRIGYRVLPGDLFSYILHLRPAEWPIMVAHTALGILLATGIPAEAATISPANIALALGAWVALLNGGTLALNSAFDDDEGDIGYLAAPPRPPRHLAAFALALMLVGQIVALRLPSAFAIAYGVCFVLSILYSLPPFRWKAVAGADWAINIVGFGALTPFAGWAATGRPIEPWAAVVFIAFGALFASLYPLTQLYQFEEDRARGDRTLALVLGMRRALQAAIATALLAFVLFGWAAAAGPANAAAFLLALPLLAWLAVLLPWYRRHERMTPAEHQRGMYAALRAWAITDIVILAIFAL